MSKNIGLYIHIPFCKSKCPYCDFYSLRGKECDYRNYVNILKKSIENWSEKTDKFVDTIYFGGGTPSVLGAELLCEILQTIKCSFKVTNDAEITFEVNPASGKFFDFHTAKKCGFNRVSIGMQSAVTEELKSLGRIHTQEDVTNTIDLIKNAGINNISLDLMMGIPYQSISSLKESIDFCISSGATHISSYILKIEENTVFYKRKNSLNLPDEDLTSDLYLFAVNYLKENSFNQYEISNFSIDDYESKHNLKYWNLDEYLGIGPGAHSFIDGKRFFYERSISDFENNIIVDDGVGGTKEEYIMLGMRLTKGISIEKYEKVFGSKITKDFRKKLDLYSKNNYINYNGNEVSFTTEGMLVSNTILSDLLFD